MTDTYSRQDAKELLRQARDDDLVVRLSRIGATPYFRFNPYTNNDGVLIRRWDCISCHFERFAGQSLLNYPHIILPQNEDGWEVNSITDEWLAGQIMKHRKGDVKIMPVKESPFGGGIIPEWE